MVCATTYIAVIGITIASWRAMSVPVSALPDRAGKDVRSAAGNPVAVALVLILAIAMIAAVKKFPKDSASAAPATIAALPPVSDDERAKLAQWWEVQPKKVVPVDAGGAKVVVVKFSDYQCPACRVTFDAYKAVWAAHANSNDVKFVLKHFPLESECNPGVAGVVHSASCEAAAAVVMARPKGTADKMENWLFANQGPPILTPDQVKRAARDVAGIQDFDAQYATALKEVRADAELGTQLKVESTPTFYINGRLVPQILAAQYFNALIEIELKRP
jgi:protein-disulfide isomerase